MSELLILIMLLLYFVAAYSVIVLGLWLIYRIRGGQMDIFAFSSKRL